MQINTSVEVKEKKTKKGPGVSDSKNDGQGVDIVPTSDYKLNAAGKKYRAHRIVFNKGEDDGKKGFNGVNEHMKKTFNSFVEQHTPELTEEQMNELIAELQEVLSKDAKAGEWISDFVKSDNPKFQGKSKEKRKQMALAAYYAAQRNEEVEQIDELQASTLKSYADKRMDNVKSRYADLTAKQRAGQPISNKEMGDYNNATRKDLNNINKARDKAAHKLMVPSMAREQVEQLEEDYVELLEAFDADDYEASHEKSKFKDGYRAVLKHKATGREVYVGGTAYKKKEHAEGEAETYKKHYNVGSGKVTPGTSMRHDRAVAEYRKNAKAAGHISEGWDDMLAASKKRSEAGKTSTATKHDVKKTSTGTVYTKQRDADGMSKEFKRDNEPATKRGRGRPKKNSFGEAVEFLMTLSEEQFDDFMSEGFDAFFESYDQLDEVSKATLGSYVKKAVSGMGGVAVNAHMAGGEKPGSEKGRDYIAKARKRIAGIEKATDRLTK